MAASTPVELDSRVVYPHFEAFYHFLSPIDHAKKGDTNKLAKLTNNQFTELSMDVYDELCRRLKQEDAFLFVSFIDPNYIS